MNTVTAPEALRVVEAFEAGADDLARKSQELTQDVLRYSNKPFSRDQFEPGHVTCSALVIHPVSNAVLLMHHHRLHRWLLPGGHVEGSDDSLAAAAAREALEETRVDIDSRVLPFLAGIDVHGIPPRHEEPFHLHHDLIWCFRALRSGIAVTDEAPMVRWIGDGEWDSLSVAESIRRSIARAG